MFHAPRTAAKPPAQTMAQRPQQRRARKRRTRAAMQRCSANSGETRAAGALKEPREGRERANQTMAAGRYRQNAAGRKAMNWWRQMRRHVERRSAYARRTRERTRSRQVNVITREDSAPQNGVSLCAAAYAARTAVPVRRKALPRRRARAPARYSSAGGGSGVIRARQRHATRRSRMARVQPERREPHGAIGSCAVVATRACRQTMRQEPQAREPPRGREKRDQMAETT